MATLSRTSGNLFRKLQSLSRNLHTTKCNRSYQNVWKACACVFGGGVLLYAANFNHGGIVYALKTKLILLQNEKVEERIDLKCKNMMTESVVNNSDKRIEKSHFKSIQPNKSLVPYYDSDITLSDNEDKTMTTEAENKHENHCARQSASSLNSSSGSSTSSSSSFSSDSSSSSSESDNSRTKQQTNPDSLTTRHNIIIAETDEDIIENTPPDQQLSYRRHQPEELVKSVKLTSRERRFIKFASVEYGGQLYMTPRDFLESVVEQEPRPRLKRRILTAKEIEQLRDQVPSLKKGSSQMFRNMRDKGIISYTEYLFLLSILTKPASGFQIAFNMFDTDGNQRVDKNEFLVIQRLLGGSLKDRELDANSERALQGLVPSIVLKQKVVQAETKPTPPSLMEKIFSFAWAGKRGAAADAPDDQGLQRRHDVDTLLQVHFFGKKGTNELKFEGFRQFMENLQTEVLELEFHEFSKGHETISEVDFAKILLRYTYLDTDSYDMYLDRLLQRDRVRGISFQEFKTFCQFLNNLEDFTIAMRMYTLADHPISKDEFQRAVKICTGQSQSAHLVATVFAIFDADGDGRLSYKEFIAIMKDRLHRGFKSYAKNEGWEAFKGCVKQEMKSSV